MREDCILKSARSRPPTDAAVLGEPEAPCDAAGAVRPGVEAADTIGSRVMTGDGTHGTPPGIPAQEGLTRLLRRPSLVQAREAAIKASVIAQNSLPRRARTAAIARVTGAHGALYYRDLFFGAAEEAHNVEVESKTGHKVELQSCGGDDVEARKPVQQGTGNGSNESQQRSTAVQQGSGKVALTIDDAPSLDLDLFAQLLDTLQGEPDAGNLPVRVSFQVIAEHVVGGTTEETDGACRSAEEAQRARRLLVRAVHEGHQLVNHGVHDRPCTVPASIGCLPVFRSVDAARAEQRFRTDLERCERLIESIYEEAGVAKPQAKWFRPPSGKMDAMMRRVVQDLGYKVVMCDAYSQDPHIFDPDFHVLQLAATAEAGSVVVMHCPESARVDGNGNSLAVRRQTLQVVPALAMALREKGLGDFVTVAELFDEHDAEAV